MVKTTFRKLEHTPDFPVKLVVPYKEKDLAKAKGAVWERDAWIAKDPAVLFKCHQWANAKDKLTGFWDRTWLDVPYLYRERAMKYGARYDPFYHCWYAPVGFVMRADLNPWRLRLLVADEC